MIKNKDTLLFSFTLSTTFDTISEQNGDGELTNHAFDAAVTAGYNPSGFDRIMYAFSFIQGSQTRAILGGVWSIYNASFSLATLIHELGHNYGLSHANSWRTTDGTVIGQGNNIEYGDLFDVMGTGRTVAEHFNVRYKRNLDWLTDANIQNVTSNGVYRIFAQDASSPGGIRALRIRKDSSKNYSVEFRQLLTQNPNVVNGAIVRWDFAGSSTRVTQVLDMTPNTVSVLDAPILIGQSFFDNINKIRITPLGKGNTTPESLDVNIELNVGCSFDLGQTIQNFSATGGEGTIPVTTQNGCYPYASVSDNWLKPAFVEDGSGSVALHYIVAANYSSQPRTGILNVAGQTFTVQQAGAVTACVQSPSNLVSWWRGEGNGLDELGMNSGELLNEITFGGGKIGGGFRFIGGPFGPPAPKVFISDSPSLALDRSLTIEGWIRINSIPSTGRYMIIMRGTEFFSLPPYQLLVNQGDGKVWFTIEGSPGAPRQFAAIASSSGLPLGQFVHIAATLDNNTGQMRLYFNKSLVAQTTTTVRPYRDLVRNAGDFGVGIGDIPARGMSSLSFDGIIDELSLYNSALSFSDIQAIYNAGTAATGGAGKCLVVRQPARFDYDGDGRTDISMFRAAEGNWYIFQSQTQSVRAQGWGLSGDRVAPADFDGDGKSDLAVFRESDSNWYIFNSLTNTATVFGWGIAGDQPVPADYNGDQKADIAVYRPSESNWYRKDSDGQIHVYAWGIAGDKPAPADFNGDGVADMTVFRPSEGKWFTINSGDASISQGQWGINGDIPIPADYSGDGKADFCVFRPSDQTWYRIHSNDFTIHIITWGLPGDLPVPGDYDGDGRSDLAVFRPSNATWFLNTSTSGIYSQPFGLTGDKPTPNAFVY